MVQSPTMDDIHSRIKERRLALELSPQQLGDDVGVSRQAVLLWETPADKKGTVPDRFKIKKVADRLKTSVAYLMFGNDANLNPDQKYAFIPRYAAAKKGTPSVNHHDEISGHGEADDTYAYRKDFLEKIGADADHCVVVFSNDSSMYIGDQLLINMLDKSLVSNKVYALKMSGNVLVRRVFLRADGKIELRADNPDFGIELYAPKQLPDVLGRVVAAQTTFA